MRYGLGNCRASMDLGVLWGTRWSVERSVPNDNFISSIGLSTDELKQQLHRVRAQTAERSAPRGKKRSLSEDLKSDDEEGVFRSASRRSGSSGLNQIQHVARDKPGRLLLQGLYDMMQYMTRRGGATAANSWDVSQPNRLVTYLVTVFFAAHPPSSLGLRICRELRAMAQALDRLLNEEWDSLGDLLMQRFEALEFSITEGNWELASAIELIPKNSVGLTSLEDRTMGSRQRLLLSKLDSKKEWDGGRTSGEWHRTPSLRPSRSRSRAPNKGKEKSGGKVAKVKGSGVGKMTASARRRLRLVRRKGEGTRSGSPSKPVVIQPSSPQKEGSEKRWPRSPTPARRMPWQK
jgi:hypothetical protein